MSWSGELFIRSLEGYFGVYFPSCEVTREIITKIPSGARRIYTSLDLHRVGVFSNFSAKSGRKE